MAKTITTGSRIKAICTCVPSERFDNLKDAKEFTQEEIKKVTAMAGIAARRVADDSTCSSDLGEVAANRVLEMTGWERDSIDAFARWILPAPMASQDKEFQDREASLDQPIDVHRRTVLENSTWR